MTLRLLFTLFIFFIYLETVGQKYLLMDKIGGKQRVEFYPGEELTFKMKGEDHFSSAIITNLQDSLIFFEYGLININDISAIKLARSRLRNLTPKLRVAGFGLIFIDQFNTMVIAGEQFSLSSGVLVVGGSIVALSYIIDLTQRNKFRIKGNRRLRIIDVGFR